MKCLKKLKKLYLQFTRADNDVDKWRYIQNAAIIIKNMTDADLDNLRKKRFRYVQAWILATPIVNNYYWNARVCLDDVDNDCKDSWFYDQVMDSRPHQLCIPYDRLRIDLTTAKLRSAKKLPTMDFIKIIANRQWNRW